ncbi:MAG: alcohol dehydrogenase catalytic domain-containing protein [Bacteroidetes bacterium]|nr:alcohol dehydrogenase catalytic domain-containing protein [Bacteroidota bacterium]
MKVLRLIDRGMFEVFETPVPELIDDASALIKINSVGVCGSDIHYFADGRIGEQVIDYPFIIGHEASGYIEELIGDDSKLNKGQLVAMDPAVSCGKCDQCLANREHTCRNLKFIGAPGQLDGMMREYIVIPKKNLYTVPDDFTACEACFIEPLSVGAYAVKLADIIYEKSFAVLGCGPIGLSVIMSLMFDKHKNIFAADKLNYRRKIAEQLGSSFSVNPNETDISEFIKSKESLGIDVVFECCGEQSALNTAVDILKPGGKLVVVGIPSTDFINFDINKLRRKEIIIINVRRQNNSMEKAISIYKEFKSFSKKLITHSFNYTESQKAFETVSKYEYGVIKAVINF